MASPRKSRYIYLIMNREMSVDLAYSLSKLGRRLAALERSYQVWQGVKIGSLLVALSFGYAADGWIKVGKNLNLGTNGTAILALFILAISAIGLVKSVSMTKMAQEEAARLRKEIAAKSLGVSADASRILHPTKLG